MKSPALIELQRLAYENNKRIYPTFPEAYFPKFVYNDKTSNQLTKSIIDFLKFNGHHAERVNTTGRPIDKRQTFTDVLGNTRQIGRLEWVYGNTMKGSADIHTLINGKAVYLEVKINKDFQKPAQIEYQKQVEQSGGIYLILKDFETFFNWYNTFRNGKN